MGRAPPSRPCPHKPLAPHAPLYPHPQVRAQNLQELVYKQGSAGITKASVSITFHNDDPANGPSGYEDKELITVTRQVGQRGRRRGGDRGGAGAGGSALSCNAAGSPARHLAAAMCSDAGREGCSGSSTTAAPSRAATRWARYTQIVIGGRDKYLINGHQAQQG